MAQAAENIVVIGGSAGGLEVLIRVVADLPPRLPAAVLVVIHVAPHCDSRLPLILRRNGPLPAMHPSDGEAIQSGHIYVAPPDRHLTVERGRMRVLQGPAENHHRPAIDPLFRSAAEVFDSRVIGLLVSGALDDGVAGLLEIKRAGGVAVVQDPADAVVPSMPRRALEQVPVDHVAAQGSIAPLLLRLLERAPARTHPDIAPRHGAGVGMSNPKGKGHDHLRAYSCPDCGGPLIETKTGDLFRYNCHEGHVLSSDSLLAAQSERLETALWAALRALDERADLSEKFAAHARSRGQLTTEVMFEARAKEARDRAMLVRQALERNEDGQREGGVEGNGGASL
jgi:two-component system, chemotaxis family, protein-glutamate methylesterase/glutaminase